MSKLSLLPTEQLVRDLAGQAGARRNYRVAFERNLGLAVVSALVIGAGMVIALVGVRPHLLLAPDLTPFLYKVGGMLLLALGSSALVRRAMLPGRGKLLPWTLLPGVLLLAFRAVSDPSSLPVLGSSIVSAPDCVLTIVAVSLPALLLLFVVVRTGAPTQPALAGAVTGLLAGALGALAYTIGCRNDGGLFVMIWYPLAIAIVAGIGAAIGRRALAW